MMDEKDKVIFKRFFNKSLGFKEHDGQADLLFEAMEDRIKLADENKANGIKDPLNDIKGPIFIKNGAEQKEENTSAPKKDLWAKK